MLRTKRQWIWVIYLPKAILSLGEQPLSHLSWFQEGFQGQCLTGSPTALGHVSPAWAVMAPQTPDGLNKNLLETEYTHLGKRCPF